MILSPDAPLAEAAEALAVTLAALDAASDLDLDRTASDRAFFAAEKAALQPSFDAVESCSQAITKHTLLTKTRLQRRVVLGDVVLDRCVRDGKTRTKMELKKLGDAEGADKTFGPDIRDVVDAERRTEPQLVLKVVSRFPTVQDFPGKAAIAADLTARAATQSKNFEDRDAGEITAAALEAAGAKAVADASDALYRLEKRLLERFPREKVYVRAFFLDVAPPRKKQAAAEPASGSTTAAPPPEGDAAKSPAADGEKPKDV
jgi:hypothetical protein